MTLQVGANNGDAISFDVGNFRFLGILSAVDKDNKTAYTTASGLQLQTASGAKAVIELMDKMIAHVDGQRSGLGAIQNRLESSIRNQSNVAANQSDARSRIRDADFARGVCGLKPAVHYSAGCYFHVNAG